MRSAKWKRAKTTLSLAAFAWAIAFSPFARSEDWTLHEQRILTFNSKIFSLERDLGEMIERKNSIDDPVALKALLKELVAKHKELETTAKDREEELLHMRFKHPEKGSLVKREYVRYQVKSLEDMEAEHGLDGKLDRIKRTIEAKYRVEPRAKKTAPDPYPFRKPAAVEDEDRVVLRK